MAAALHLLVEVRKNALVILTSSHSLLNDVENFVGFKMVNCKFTEVYTLRSSVFYRPLNKTEVVLEHPRVNPAWREQAVRLPTWWRQSVYMVSQHATGGRREIQQLVVSTQSASQAASNGQHSAHIFRFMWEKTKPSTLRATKNYAVGTPDELTRRLLSHHCHPVFILEDSSLHPPDRTD